MARAYTAGELVTLRSSGHATRIQVAFPEFHTIYTAELDTVPTSNDQVGEIAFTNGSGTLGDVLADMTLYVGTSAGAFDLGMCRIRKAPIAGTFYVGEISEIEWDAGGTIYLTVVDDYGLWSRPVRLVSGVAKMEYDVDYSDQHEDFDPVPVLGSHKVGKLSGGTVTVQLGPSADTASWVEDSTISSYAWVIAGADSISNAAIASPTAVFSTAGTYLAYCTVTAANGKSFKGVRYIVIYDDDNPLKQARLRGWSYDYESGGLAFNIEMDTGAGVSAIRKRALAILVTEDTLDNVSESPPCPINGSENILGIGWIAQENIDFHQKSSAVEFTIHNAAYWMKSMEGYLSGIEITAATPDDWTNMQALTVRRMLWHFLHWRTTATRIMDVTLTSDTKYMAGLKTITGALWEQVNTIALTTIFARPGVDRFNRLFVEVEPQMEASRGSIPEVITLTESDWSSIKVLETHDVLSMLYWSGVSVNASGDPLAYVSLSPGHIHKRYGSTETGANYLVSSQSQCNQMCGLYFGWKNNAFQYEIDLVHAPRLLDLWPRQYINLTVSAAEDPRGVGYDGSAVPRRLEFRHNPQAGALDVFLVVEPETFEGLSINGDIPDSVDDGAIPPLPPLPSLPPLPPIDLALTPVVVGDETLGPSTVLISTSNFGFLYTTNFNEDDPEWFQMNAGMTSTEYNDVQRVLVAPSGAIFALCILGSVRRYSWELWRTESLGAPWEQIYSDSPTTAIEAIGVNPDVDEELMMLSGPSGSMDVYLWDGATMTQTAAGLDARIWGSDVVHYGDGWFCQHARSNAFSSQCYSRFSAAGGIQVNSQTYPTTPPQQTFSSSHHRAVGGGGYVYAWNLDKRFLRTIIDGDGAASLTAQPDIGDQDSSDYPQLIACDPTGQYLMGSDEDTLAKKSSDYGASWGNVDASLGIGYRMFENCKGSPTAFLTGTTQVVKYTPDFGTTWEIKTGNLASVAPLCAINHIRFVSW